MPLDRKRKSAARIALILAALFPAYAASLAFGTPETQNPAVDLASDPGLRRLVSVQAKGEPLPKALRIVTADLAARVRVKDSLRGRRVHAFADRREAWRILDAMAYAVNATWKREDGAYVLFQTERQRERERRASELSTRRTEEEKRLRRSALEEAVRNSDNRMLNAMISNLRPDERALLMEAADESPGIISAGNQSHLLPHFLFASPIDRQDAAFQAAFARGIGQETDSVPDFPLKGPPLERGGGTLAGLVALNGSVRLGVLNPASGELWVSRASEIRRPGIPGVDTDNDYCAEVNEAVSAPLIDATLAAAERQVKKRIRFPRSLDRTRFSSILEHLARETGLPIVADDFWASDGAYPWLLTDMEAYTLTAAVDQIARSFIRRFQYRRGVLCARSACIGFHLAAEPPHDLVERLVTAVEKRQPASPQDFVDLAALRYTQLNSLIRHHPSMNVRTWADRAYRLRRALRFQATLSPEQRQAAEEEKGLPADQLSREQKKLFSALAVIGIPLRVRGGDAPSFRLENEIQREKVVRMRFSFLTPDGPTPGASCMLDLR